jgi:hypothetical protein
VDTGFAKKIMLKQKDRAAMPIQPKRFVLYAGIS